MCRKYRFQTQFFLLLNLEHFSTAFQGINWTLFNDIIFFQSPPIPLSSRIFLLVHSSAWSSSHLLFSESQVRSLPYWNNLESNSLTVLLGQSIPGKPVSAFSSPASAPATPAPEWGRTSASPRPSSTWTSSLWALRPLGALSSLSCWSPGCALGGKVALSCFVDPSVSSSWPGGPRLAGGGP